MTPTTKDPSARYLVTIKDRRIRDYIQEEAEDSGMTKNAVVSELAVAAAKQQMTLNKIIKKDDVE